MWSKWVPQLKTYAHQLLEYGENKEECYWTCDKFVIQTRSAVEMAELNHPKEEGWCHVWVFDHNSCHAAMADDPLDATKTWMSIQGESKGRWGTQFGKEWCSQWWQTWCAQGIASGAEREGHVDMSGMTTDQMKATLAAMDDFIYEKSLVEHQKGHIPA